MTDQENKDVEMARVPSNGVAAAAKEIPAVEHTELEKKEKKKKKKKACTICCCCCACCCVSLLVLLAIAIALALTVFKARKPDIRVQDVRLEELSAGLSFNLPPEPYLNLTLAIQVSLHNPNKVAFAYSNSTAHLLYYDQEVGTVSVPAGRVGPDQTRPMSTLLTLQAARLVLGNSHFLPDLAAGALPFTTTADVSGRVTILGFIKRHVDTSTTCQLVVFIGNSSLSNTCSYSYHLSGPFGGVFALMVTTFEVLPSLSQGNMRLQATQFPQSPTSRASIELQ